MFAVRASLAVTLLQTVGGGVDYAGLALKGKSQVSLSGKRPSSVFATACSRLLLPDSWRAMKPVFPYMLNSEVNLNKMRYVNCLWRVTTSWKCMTNRWNWTDFGNDALRKQTSYHSELFDMLHRPAIDALHWCGVQRALPTAAIIHR